VEQRLGVPYRFPKDFHGTVTSGSESREVAATYFVRPLDEDVELFLDPLRDELLANGGARSAMLGDGLDVLVVDASAIAATAGRRLEDNPDFLLTRGHALV
jgi:hypothetical protein